MKNKEIPSIPIVKLKFKKGIQANLLTNWKELVDLLKKTHKSRDITYKLPEIFKAIAFSSEWFQVGTKKIINVPNKGNIKIRISKFVTFNKEKSNINIL